MPFQPGHELHKVGKKRGRKSIAQEVAHIKEILKEEITNEALLKLARSKVFAQLNSSDKYQVAKELGLPIALKGITDKIEISDKRILIDD
jgi:hypothetical protein